MLLFEMIAGYPPFFSTNPFAVYQKILQNKVKYPSVFSRSARSVVSDWLSSSRSGRLGCGIGGFGSITRHSFFGSISWESAKKMQLQPILIPVVALEGDSSNFDFYAEEEQEQSSNLTALERKLFENFDEIVAS